MPKRKSHSPSSPGISLTSFDAALDLLACETFARVHRLADNFEAAAGVRLQDGVACARWDEAVRRYWLMKSLDGLRCGAAADSGGKAGAAGAAVGAGAGGGDEAMKEDTNPYERPISDNHHPGAVAKWQLDADEAQQWRRWTPRAGDLVLVDLPERGVWPGKIIDRRISFYGRTIPKGNHFYAVRIYSEDIQPTVTVKARLVPLHLRPDPPLACPAPLQTAYEHVLAPTTFDAVAGVREARAAQTRAAPPVSGTDGSDTAAEAAWRADREAWKRFVNWLMNERRVEKARALGEERERRLRAVAAVDEAAGGKLGREGGLEGGSADDVDGGVEMEDRSGEAAGARKKRCPDEQWAGAGVGITKVQTANSGAERGGIFHLSTLGTPPPRTRTPVPATPPGTSSGAAPSIAAYIRPALSALVGPSARPASPRRADRRLRASVADASPRRGSGGAGAGTCTPPRGAGATGTDDRMPPSPTAPRLLTFDFVSPLGPVRFGRLRREDGDGDEQMDGGDAGAGGAKRPAVARRASLEAVKEEPDEAGADDAGWTVVRRGKRAGSAPCDAARREVVAGVDGDAMDL